MEKIWKKVCDHHDVPEQVAKEWFARIQEHLSSESPSRAYHNWQEMMQRKEPHLAGCANPNIVLAAFFQYYHFDGNRSCSEENIEVFEEFCQDAVIEDDRAKSLVCNLLGRKTPENELTWCHDDEANLLQDVDLVVLASSPEEYKHYTTLLRSEYANLDDATYKAMRIKVLETLLMIPSIYATGEYHDKYEELARTNIRSEIRELRQKELWATAVPQQNTESPSTSKQPGPSRQKFRKFRDRKAKKPPKRLQAKAKQIKNLDQKCISKIKKKYNIQKNPQVQHKWQFLRNSPKKNSGLPKPKVYTPQKKIAKNIEAIEEGELIESSDDDDCVLLDTTITINADDSDADTEAFSSDKFFEACQRRAEKIATPKIFKDSQRQASLFIKQKSDNPLLYSTICKSDFASDISCVNLIDSPEEPVMPKPSYNANDSVILLDDSIAGEDFIPLLNPLAMNVAEKETPRRPPQRKNIIKKSGRMSISQFTKEEKKKVGDYNSNTFNPTEETDGAGQSGDKPKSHKRSIIIDGSNVAFAHGNSNMFSSDGINYCLQYFEKMGHNAKAVVPSFRRNAFKSSNPEMLDKLHKQGKIVFTPCKNIPGQKSISYDDRFILQLAYEWNAAIVSNDNYRDLIDESPAFKKIVETRVLGYTWCDNIFILPKDPYGRWGPTLDEILKC